LNKVGKAGTGISINAEPVKPEVLGATDGVAACRRKGPIFVYMPRSSDLATSAQILHRRSHRTLKTLPFFMIFVKSWSYRAYEDDTLLFRIGR